MIILPHMTKAFCRSCDGLRRVGRTLSEVYGYIIGDAGNESNGIDRMPGRYSIDKGHI
jgi:hypothetical protein